MIRNAVGEVDDGEAVAAGERHAAARQLSGLGRSSGPPSAAGGNALQRLIQKRLRERGWSYGAVARRGGLPRSTVYNLATNENLARPPQLETMEKLARGLELPPSALRVAAAEATGLRMYRSDPMSEEAAIIAGIEELTPEDRRVVANLIEALRRTSALDGHNRDGARSPSSLSH